MYDMNDYWFLMFKSMAPVCTSMMSDGCFDTMASGIWLRKSSAFGMEFVFLLWLMKQSESDSTG